MGVISQKLLAGLLLVGVAVAGPAMASKSEDQSGSPWSMNSRSILNSEKVAERTAPDAKVCLQGEDCGEASAAAPKEEVAFSPEGLYNSTCAACHGAGVLGAPVPGQADQWAPRLAKGTDAVYANALNGLNAMPPKGGCGGCSDEEIKATVDFMIEQSK